MTLTLSIVSVLLILSIGSVTEGTSDSAESVWGDSLRRIRSASVVVHHCEKGSSIWTWRREGDGTTDEGSEAGAWSETRTRGKTCSWSEACTKRGMIESEMGVIF